MASKRAVNAARVEKHFSEKEQVFSKLLSELIESSLDDCNICLFAYGQTGAGKDREYCVVNFVELNLSLYLLYCAKVCIKLAGPMAHLRFIVPTQHSSFQKNVAAVAIRWRLCIPFDRYKM